MSKRANVNDLATEFVELRVEQDARILDGSLPQEVASLLRLRSWELAKSDERHRSRSGWTATWNRSRKAVPVPDRPLSELLEEAMRLGFLHAVSRYRDAVAARLQELEKRASTRRQRRENGKLLAEEGREKRKPITDKRTATICKLYAKVRKSFAPGSRGNGETIREVCRRFGPLPGRDNSITPQAVRDALKRGGVACE